MTQVRFEYVRPVDGALQPITGKLLIGLHHRDAVSGKFRTTDRFDAELVDGVAIVNLAPTGPTQGWVIREQWLGGKPLTVYAVPDSGAVLLATELTQLDPASLDPDAEPGAAWDAALAAAVSYLEEQISSNPGAGGGGGVSFDTDDDGTPVLVISETANAVVETDSDGTPVLVIGA